MLCQWNGSWCLKTVALLTWIDGHVSPASWMNTMWCTAREHRLRDQPRSKNENDLYWMDHAFVSFSLCLMFLHLHNLYGLIHCWHTPNGKGLQTNDTSIWIVANVFLVAIFFNFHHAPSVRIHRSLRLWCQQLLSVSNWLFPPLCLLPISWIIRFVFHQNNYHAFQVCNHVFFI